MYCIAILFILNTLIKSKVLEKTFRLIKKTVKCGSVPFAVKILCEAEGQTLAITKLFDSGSTF